MLVVVMLSVVGPHLIEDILSEILVSSSFFALILWQVKYFKLLQIVLSNKLLSFCNETENFNQIFKQIFIVLIEYLFNLKQSSLSLYHFKPKSNNLVHMMAQQCMLNHSVSILISKITTYETSWLCRLLSQRWKHTHRKSKHVQTDRALHPLNHLI